MIRSLICAAALWGGVAMAAEGNRLRILDQQPWYETRSPHFNIYSYADRPKVFALAVQLEQFREALRLMGIAEPVSSPPILVMAFPDQIAMEPFLPLYQGQPINAAAFFQRGSDENLIVLAFTRSDSPESSMEIIYHEYTHLLFRRNAREWPLWFVEGIAEFYSTCQTTGRVVRLGRPSTPAVEFLKEKGVPSLADLFSVKVGSPQYNERDRQGSFYAGSWLATHFLVAGDPAYRGRLTSFLKFLSEGQLPEQAFSNAVGALPALDAALSRYLARGQFTPIQLMVSADIASPRSVSVRQITPVEIRFLLGKELLRVNRLSAAEASFWEAQRLAPASPLPWEGLGLVAAKREQSEQAVRQLEEALRRGPVSYLGHYTRAREKYLLASGGRDYYATLAPESATVVRSELRQTVAMMPTFGPAHHLLGVLEMLQRGDAATAERELQLAIELEPDNPTYLLSLAQAQFMAGKPGIARRTLEPLLRPSADAELRTRAQELLRKNEAR